MLLYGATLALAFFIPLYWCTMSLSPQPCSCPRVWERRGKGSDEHNEQPVTVETTTATIATTTPASPPTTPVQKITTHGNAIILEAVKDHSDEEEDYLREKYRWAAAELKRAVLAAKGQKPKDRDQLQPPDLEPRTAEEVLAIATLNVWGLGHDWPARKQNILNLFAALPTDIIALQEVHRTANIDAPTQAHELAQALQLPHVAVHFVHQDPAHPDTDEALAILSRFPILQSDIIFLNDSKLQTTDPNPRAAVHAVVDVRAVGLKTIHIAATHFTYHADNQCAMALALVRAAAQRLRDEGGAPLFLLGDTQL